MTTPEIVVVAPPITPRTPLERYMGILTCLVSSTSLVLMDLFAQYLLVIDPMNPVSVMLLRMVPCLIFVYIYLCHIKADQLPFGSKNHRNLLLIRSAGVVGLALQMSFMAIRHIRWV